MGEAVGEVELDGRVLVLRRITVTYRLRVGPDVDAAAVERVMRVHPAACPVYRSLHPQIAISTALELDRGPGEGPGEDPGEGPGVVSAGG